MKNFKRFLSLALALTFLVWPALKVLAVNYPTIDVEATMAGWPSALGLLEADNSLIQGSGDFGYYVPAWERGQVLGDTVTAAPSGASTNVSGTTPSGASTNVSGTTPPASGAADCGTAPECGANYSLKYPASGCPYCEVRAPAVQPGGAATAYCAALGAAVTTEQCAAANQADSVQPGACPARSLNCPSWVPAAGNVCGWCNYSGSAGFNSPQDQPASIVNDSQTSAERGPTIDWTAITKEIGKITTEANRMLKQKDVSYVAVSNIVKNSTDSVKEIKAAIKRKEEADLADKYSGSDSIVDNLRALLNQEKARVAYGRESIKITAEYDKAAKFLAGLKPLKYISADVNGWKGSLEYYKKILQKAAELAAGDNPEEARNVLLGVDNDNRPADIYCVALAARDFDKNIGLVKDASIRGSLIDRLVNPIFAGSSAETRAVCQFISRNGIKSSITALIKSARGVNKLSAKLSQRFQSLQIKIDGFGGR